MLHVHTERKGVLVTCLLIATLMCQCDVVFSISSLTSSPGAADQDGVAGVCPNIQVSFTCSIDGRGSNLTTWTLSPFSPICQAIVTHAPPVGDTCGSPVVLQITSVSDSEINADRSSVALLDNPENDQIVTCFDGAGTGGTLIGQISLCLIGFPQFTGLRQNNSQNTLNGSAVVVWTPPSKCPGDTVTYTVRVVDDNGTEVQFSSINSSSITITGLVPNSVYTVNVTAENSCGATYSQTITVRITVEVLPPTFVRAAITCSTSPPAVNVQWAYNTTTSSGSTLYPDPDFVYINSTSLSGEVNVTKILYPGTSTSLLLTRQTNYSIVASSVKDGFSESMNNPQVSVHVEAFSIDIGTVSTDDECITVTLSRQCNENDTLFTCQLSYGLCTGQRVTVTGTFDSTTNSTCLPLSNIPLGEICYEVSLSYNGVLLQGSNQSDSFSLRGCTTSLLDTLTGSGVTYTPDRSESSPGILPHGTSVMFACGSTYQLRGAQTSVCRDGTWTIPEDRSCVLSEAIIAVIIIFVLLAVIVAAVVITIIIIVYFCCCRKPPKDEHEHDVELKKTEYPTGDEYAVVDTSKKKKKPAVNDEATDANVQSLYQDPNTIQHEQAAGGELYAVAERPKKGSKKEKSEQELAGMYSVPDKKNKSQLTYADIDVGVGGRKPVNPVPEMEYATVVN